MQIKVVASLVAIAASLAIASSSKPLGPTDEQIKALSRFPFDPPYTNQNPTDKANTGWNYPPQALVRIPKSREGKCDFKVIMDGSRCAGMQSRQEVVVAPYDQYSTDMLMEDKAMEFQTGQKNNRPYAQRVFHLNKCGFNGRFFLMDQAHDNVFDTSRMSIRVVMDEGHLQAWVTANPDEELGIQQTRNAPLIYLYSEDELIAKSNRTARITGDENHRGMAKSMRVYKKTSDNYLYIQYC